MRQCCTCVYWDRSADETSHGRCHRYPPTPNDSMDERDGYTHRDMLARWPVTLPDAWCGEFKHRVVAVVRAKGVSK